MSTLKNEVEKLHQQQQKNEDSSDTVSSPASPGSPSSPSSTSSSSLSVSQTMAKIAPLTIILRYLAKNRFSCDIVAEEHAKSGTNVLDLIASVFTLPGRQLQQQNSLTLGAWAHFLPREEVRQFVIRSIKLLDAAAKEKDSLQMKVTIASLAAVVNAYPFSVPSFVPASLMKLVKFKNMITLTRDELEELALKQQKENEEKQQQHVDPVPAVTSAATASTDPQDTNNIVISSPLSPMSKKKSATEDYKSLATEGLQQWWAVHLQSWDQEFKANFTETQAQAIGDACKARSYFV